MAVERKEKVLLWNLSCFSIFWDPCLSLFPFFLILSLFSLTSFFYSLIFCVIFQMNFPQSFIMLGFAFFIWFLFPKRLCFGLVWITQNNAVMMLYLVFCSVNFFFQPSDKSVWDFRTTLHFKQSKSYFLYIKKFVLC